MKKPYKMNVKEGQRYFWCSCGFSQDVPFCDGSHRGQSDKRSLCFTIEHSGEVFLCTCQKTAAPPYCDGSQEGCKGFKN